MESLEGAANDREHQQSTGHEQQLPGLDADVEEKQRERDGVAGQADLVQCSREAEAVEQAEDEGDDPGRARRDAFLPSLPVRRRIDFSTDQRTG